MSAPTEPSLTATHTIDYTYKRSLGPILSRFFTALRDRQILGIRRPDGSVMVPPKDYDPDTGTGLEELVEVADEGVVKSWAWVAAPRSQQPLDRPFAYALVQLDGSATPFLHVVDAGSEDAMRVGLRVKARWAETTVGAIGDFVFVPAGSADGGAGGQR